MPMSETLRFIVTSEYDGVKAGRYLRTYCRLSSRTLTLLKKTKDGITANGKLLRSIDIIHTGDIIEIRFTEEKSSILPVFGNLDVVYEDSFLLIVNKPESMPVHPVKKHQSDTLANIIAYRYADNSSGLVFRAVNRLDADTSGLVIITKDRHTASLMQNTDVEKHYTAICHGDVPTEGTIDEPIDLLPDSKIVRCVSSEGQRAVTHYKKTGDVYLGSVVDLVLETGRTHQIRCHMAHIGHPLFGDDLYGGSCERITRQALHCKSVRFIHPFTSGEIFVETELPVDMLRIINEQ